MIPFHCHVTAHQGTGMIQLVKIAPTRSDCDAHYVRLAAKRAAQHSAHPSARTSAGEGASVAADGKAE